MQEKTTALSVIEAIAKLLNVKSLVTIALTIGFIVQSVRGQLSNEYSSVYLVVISFYFGTQYQKNVEEASYASNSERNFP